VPLYEYKCGKCAHTFEKIESYSAPETRKCPKCGAKAERVLAPPAIQFKGTGWYVTDYAGKSSSKSGDGESKPASAKEESSSSKPAESKESATKEKTKKAK
jgi:putative FmdB family regulatory protein